MSKISYEEVLETSGQTFNGLKKSLARYLEEAKKPFKYFPKWEDLVDANAVGDYICKFSKNAQRYAFLSAECRVKRIQGEEFVRQLRKWAKHFGQSNGANLFPIIEKTEFVLDKMREVSYVFKDKHGQVQEDINSLKVMIRVIID